MLYEHYKGGIYKVLHATAIDEATQEKVIVYASVKTGDVWVRTRKNFCEYVEKDGERVQRFKPIY